ncbi:50 kDa gamma-zein-like [Panicum virgatum]|uniref:50 kDa gamma-zein-like n=1 Tax=Panicum virgatum TaxID=38727 RepID=UPI0019D54C08|nr:50 kDa gamma-zein-like [Panicum virgatum]
MKEMIVILAFTALIASATSMQIGPCSCGEQGHEQHQQQKNHPQQQQQQHHQQQKVHLQQQPQQEHHEQSEQQHHDQPQQQHPQQYQDKVQQQPPQHQYYQQRHNQPLLQQQLNNCHEFLRQQCNPLAMPFLQSRLLQPSSCQVLRQQCCQELRQIKPGYLHQAINSMVRSFTYHQQQQEDKQQAYGFYGPQQASQSEMAILMAAQYLPSMCGMYHLYGQNNPCHKDATRY